MSLSKKHWCTPPWQDLPLPAGLPTGARITMEKSYKTLPPSHRMQYLNFTQNFPKASAHSQFKCAQEKSGSENTYVAGKYLMLTTPYANVDWHPNQLPIFLYTTTNSTNSVAKPGQKKRKITCKKTFLLKRCWATLAMQKKLPYS